MPLVYLSGIKMQPKLRAARGIFMQAYVGPNAARQRQPIPLDADSQMGMEPNQLSPGHLTLGVNSVIETNTNQTCFTDGE